MTLKNTAPGQFCLKGHSLHHKSLIVYDRDKTFKNGKRYEYKKQVIPTKSIFIPAKHKSPISCPELFNKNIKFSLVLWLQIVFVLRKFHSVLKTYLALAESCSSYGFLPITTLIRVDNGSSSS